MHIKTDFLNIIIDLFEEINICFTNFIITFTMLENLITNNLIT